MKSIVGYVPVEIEFDEHGAPIKLSIDLRGLMPISTIDTPIPPTEEERNRNGSV
jgi:hypothetical protein